jgi:uncharacterized protein YraI
LDYTQLTVLDPQVTLPLQGRSENFQWLYVEYQPGKFGWVAAWIVTIAGDLSSVPVITYNATSVPDPDPVNGVTAHTWTGVNLRSQPSVTSSAVGGIPAGATVPVNGRNDTATWIAVTYKEQPGWVYASLVSLSGGTVRDLPVVDGTPPTEPTPVGTIVALTGVDQHTREIFLKGQALGNYRNRFTRVGDSEMALPRTLTGFDEDYYNLGPWTNLQDTVGFFHGSYAHISQAAVIGQPITALLDPYWADPDFCLPGENGLECEYRIYKPSVALILLRIHGNHEDWLEIYETHMREVIETSLDYGVIPVLTLHFKFRDVPAAAEEMNLLLQELGEEYQIPVWDLFSSTLSLPDNGVDMTNHLTASPTNNFDFSTAENMQYGKVVHNLEALQVLDILMHQVSLQQ